MKLRTLLSLLFGARTRPVLGVMRHLRPFYRACYVAGLADNGMLAVLAAGPVPFETLVTRFSPTGARRERDALDAWLRLGVSLKEVKSTPQGYELRGGLARRLARPDGDTALAVLQSIVHHHYQFLTGSLGRLRSGNWFTLADLDGELVARAARALEPLVYDAIDAAVPKQGPFTLLDVGCGSAGYIRHAALRNRDLHALGLELGPEVADLARRNIVTWGLEGRVTVRAGDVRDCTPEPVYDLVTLHNNIYYFPPETRVPTLKKLRGFLRPGGRILITTHCLGSWSGGCIGLFAALTEGCGRLPSREEMVAQLREAGYDDPDSRRLIPFDEYAAFVAGNGPADHAGAGRKAAPTGG
jgi:SAM-dependent methyltransferase